MVTALIVSLLACWLPPDDGACIVPTTATRPTEGQVTVLVVDPHDLARFERARITLQDEQRAFTLEPGKPRTIPFGVYTVSVRDAGFPVRDSQVVVDRPDVVVRLPVHGDIMFVCGETQSYISGAVTGSPASRELWAKVVQVAGTASHEVKLSPSGYFLFDHLANGKYVLLLLDETRVVHTEVVDVPRGERRAINLKIRL